MKKLKTILLAVATVFGLVSSPVSADAVDFRAKGQWLTSFDLGANGDFTAGGKGGATGWGKTTMVPDGQDQFNAQSRLRLQLEAVASDFLSGVVQFEIGSQTWGKADQGGALGSDGNNVKLKSAYLDFLVPNLPLSIRMGIQPMALPNFTTGSQLFSEDGAGVVASMRFSEALALSLFWARTYNDNGGYKGKVGYMDNADFFGLAVPVTLDGIKIIPFGIMAFVGPGVLRQQEHDVYGQLPFYEPYGLQGTAGNDTVNGMIPLAGSADRDGRPVYKTVTGYGTAIGGGLALDLTLFDPFHFALDFNYASMRWPDNAHLNRAGWLVSALAEYKTDWGIPGLVGWYASGDDGNPKNGSERMPVVGQNSTHNDFADFAFSSQRYLDDRHAIIAKSMVGTWGIGARIKDLSFIEDLKHTIRVNYIGGTNSPRLLKKIYNNDRMIDTVPMFGQYGTPGCDGLYMTTNDSAIEFSLLNEYQIYENLTIAMQASYLATSLTGSNRLVPDSGNNRPGVRDPWNINLTFAYSF